MLPCGVGDERTGGLPEDGQLILTKMYLDVSILILEGLCRASLPTLLCQWYPVQRAASATMGELRGECGLAG